MISILICFAAVLAAEVLLWTVLPMRYRRTFAPCLTACICVVSLGLVLKRPDLPTIIVLILSFYRMANLLRLVIARMNRQYLQKVTATTGVWLLCMQTVILGLWYTWSSLHYATSFFWPLFTSLDLAGVVILLVSTIRHVKTTVTPPLSNTVWTDNDLPTLTVAIPARNETAALDACLTSLIASDYPKLEIIVLDDCSQQRRTPEIIRSYAHAGVRFLEGKVPEESWLAKNFAYQQLLEASSGELVLFCGVDVRFTTDSLRKLVYAMLLKNKSMISVIPRNVTPRLGNWEQSMLLQPMRYAWEIALPRRLFKRPPVLSTCWIIRRSVIETAGGFAAVSRSIVPESYFARVATIHDGYSFMQSDDGIGVISAKDLSDQLQTVVRTRYPQVHRRPELVALLSVTELGGLVLPLWVIFSAGLHFYRFEASMVSLCTLLLLAVVYTLIVSLTYRRYLLRSLLAMPIAVLIDVLLLNYSMLAYEFFQVTWKGRNVCIPVMHITTAGSSNG